MTDYAEPPPPQERIPTLDSARGLALPGIRLRRRVPDKVAAGMIVACILYPIVARMPQRWLLSPRMMVTQLVVGQLNKQSTRMNLP